MHGYPQHPVVSISSEELNAMSGDIMDQIVELRRATDLKRQIQI